MIPIIFAVTFLYCALTLACAHYFGIFPATGSTRMKCGLPPGRIAAAEAAIFGVSLYLNLLLGILTATGDSSFFVSVMTRFTQSDSPFAGYYARGGITYPPLFNYIYYLLAQALQLLHIPISYTSEAFILAVKLPGILCEFAMAWMLYRYAKKNLPKGQTIPILLLTLLNPAYLLVTAYICQIDALYVFFMLLTVMLSCEHRLKLSYFTFAAAIMCKFQAIFITPVLILAAVREVMSPAFSPKKFRRHLLAALAAVCCMFVSYLPFVWDAASGTFYKGGVTINFATSIKSYGLASQNTYNFWTLLGYNYLSEDLACGPFTCKDWGMFFIVLLVLLCAALFLLHKGNPHIYPMLGAVLVSGTVCFATRMMPRYLYPAVPLLILGYLLYPSRRRFLCALCFTAALFLLNGFDYLIYPMEAYAKELVLPRVVAVYLLGCVGFLVSTVLREASTFIIPIQSEK